MTTTPELNIYPDLGGGMNAGYLRTDAPIVHVIVRTEADEAFRPSDHWPCPVCKAHGFSVEHFRDQWQATLIRAAAAEWAKDPRPTQWQRLLDDD